MISLLPAGLQDAGNASAGPNHEQSVDEMIHFIRESRRVYNSAMRIVIVAGIVLLMFVSPACSGFGPPPKTYTFSNATGAEQYERLMWDAIKKKDHLAISSHLAATYVKQGRDGTKNKEQVLADLDQLSLSDYSIGNLNVTPQGADMIVTYDITFVGMMAGKPLPNRPIRFLSVWQQQSKGWSLIAQSEIPAQ